MTTFLALALAMSVSAAPVAASERPGAASLGAQAEARAIAALDALARAESGARHEITATRAAAAQPGGDSLKNGAIIGAVVGAAGWGGFVYWLCRALDETGGDANCAGGALVWAGIAGAAGAAIGAGVDALFDGPAVTRSTGRKQPGRFVPAGASIRIRF